MMKVALVSGEEEWKWKVGRRRTRQQERSEGRTEGRKEVVI